jgi:tripartite ATP-independent transporter DctM subunit
MTFCFLFFGYLGVPVPFSLMAGVFVGAVLSDVSLAAIIQKMFDGVDSEALLAIPFFLLVGELMSSANVVVRVANLSLALVGHIRGGLSQVVTVFSMFFSEMSGSTTADVAVISRALGGPMKKEGYEPAFIAAIIAAASTIAALVPPSITAVIYGAVGNVSIAGLFMAGVVPGLMIGFGLMIYCFFFGPPGRRTARAPFGEVALAARDAALPMMIPVILLGGILTGWFTPTEAGLVAVVWIIAVIIPALNRGHLWALPYDFCVAALIFSLPLITIGAANAFGWMLAYMRGAIVIADWITAIAGNDPHLIMLLLVVLFTIIGDFIEPVPTIIIFMPLVNTLTQVGDINAVHMGVVLIATLAFGLITPPYGLVLLMASKFVGVRFSQALRAALPIYVVFLVTIASTIYFPSVVIWLPKQDIPASVACFKAPDGPGYICPNRHSFASFTEHRRGWVTQHHPPFRVPCRSAPKSSQSRIRSQPATVARKPTLIPAIRERAAEMLERRPGDAVDIASPRQNPRHDVRARGVGAGSRQPRAELAGAQNAQRNLPAGTILWCTKIGVFGLITD